MILEHGFSNLSLGKIVLSVFSDNLPAIKSYEKAGFSVEDVQANAVERISGSRDVIIMSITKDTWKNII